RDLLVRAIEDRDVVLRDRFSRILEALLHLDGEVRRHAEPRFLVEATLVRLAVQDGAAAASPMPPSAAASTVVAPIPARVSVAASSAMPTPAPSAAPTSASAPAPAPVSGDGQDFAAGWQRLLERLPPKTRAYFRAARAEAEGDHLVLSFPYGFHHKMAQESAAQ